MKNAVAAKTLQVTCQNDKSLKNLIWQSFCIQQICGIFQTNVVFFLTQCGDFVTEPFVGMKLACFGSG